MFYGAQFHCFEILFPIKCTVGFTVRNSIVSKSYPARNLIRSRTHEPGPAVE